MKCLNLSAQKLTLTHTKTYGKHINIHLNSGEYTRRHLDKKNKYTDLHHHFYDKIMIISAK
jgi:hypothetical protein